MFRSLFWHHLTYDSRCTQLDSLFNVSMSVGLGTFDGNKQSSLFDFSRVDLNIGYFFVGCSFYANIRNRSDYILQFHNALIISMLILWFVLYANNFQEECFAMLLCLCHSAGLSILLLPAGIQHLWLPYFLHSEPTWHFA